MSTKPPSKDLVTAAILVIGDEILSGRTKDKNLPYISEWLNDLGVQVREARVIPDIEDVIAATVNDLRANFDYVFTTGGIGPTHDDITADSIAKAFDVGIDHDPRAVAILEGHYEAGQLNEARMRMARIPDGADLIENPVSKAPGFQLENVFVMAGVPMIMQAMLESLRHRIVGGKPVLSGAVGSLLPEGKLAAGLSAIQDDFPGVSVGSYPFFRSGKVGTNLVARTTDGAALEVVLERIRALVHDLDGETFEGALMPANEAQEVK